jgi:zinc/manganese transport system permease protein
MVGKLVGVDRSRGEVLGELRYYTFDGLNEAFDLPTGSAMVCVFGVSLAMAGLLYLFLRGGHRRALRGVIATARWTGAAIFAASALQLAIAPRADQPLMDIIEYAVPSLRTLYFTRAEQTTFVEASEYAERYRREAEQLNDVERRNRTEGKALDDFSVARISSFLKSYGEMRKGEQFVMGEVRAQARERIRWGVGLGLLVLALLVSPVSWRRLWAHAVR